MLTLMSSLTSCGFLVEAATERATEAAKDYWDANREEIISGASDAARQYWSENKDEIIDTAKEDMSKVGDIVLETAKDYVDDQLAAQRSRAVDKLIAEGYKREDIDADGNGEITDDELRQFVTSNPTAMWAGGGALLLWFGLSLANRKKKKDVESAT